MRQSPSRTVFPSKILLFGEHLVLYGAEALSVPYSEYAIELFKSKNGMPPEFHLLWNYAQLQSEFNNRFNTENYIWLSENYSMRSSIPIGYGLGSSGAFVALFYSYCILEKPSELGILKNELALLENFFHQSSSGIDPLTSYINCPIVISDQMVSKLTFDWQEKIQYKLIDSKKPRSSKEGIEKVRKWIDENPENRFALQEVIQLSNNVIGLLKNNQAVDIDTIKQIMKWQDMHWRFLITESMEEIWRDKLKNPNEAMKICGAGCGGVYLEFYK